jgi:polyribonucleotide nucleotidyltransferase
MMNIIQKSIELPDGQVITIETGKMAKQADGSIILKQGKTMLLATVVSATEAKPDVDFMPLSVEYKKNLLPTGVFPEAS